MKAIFDADANYAVRAGGHSGMKGWNNVDGGVLISFSAMTAVSYDPSRDTITLEPGIVWADAVEGLQSQGVAAVGARFNDVGTGFLLGGGISFLSPSQGYGADNNVELDVVLVNGTLVTATVDNEYADLFKALKGGANRFGIVTRFEVRAVHTGTADDKSWFGGLITYPPSSHGALLSATAHFAHNSTDPNAVLLSSYNNVANSIVGNAYMFYNGTIAQFNRTFAEFLSIPQSTSSLGPMSYIDIDNILASSTDESGHLQLMAGTALEGKAAGEDIDSWLQTYDLWNNYSTTFADQLTFGVLAISPVPQPQILAGRQKGGNAMNPPLKGFANLMFQIALPIADSDLSDEMISAREDYLQRSLQTDIFAPHLRAPTDAGFPINMNEHDVTQDAFETYGELELLKSTYAKYDPTGFNLAHTDGPFGLG
ncbi:hypothetical protein EIP91_009432 [Steccherinum ochraceum]|uniref:FAD-binding PCMH-type domain-containing protein n=1 Tax=Steccherinum ochraceum TaxID=92696 RepID=A0A4R0R9Q4_9APHY|nr:hypothetical protein EIP91_009432 [Steccherinum ochraceum]